MQMVPLTRICTGACRIWVLKMNKPLLAGIASAVILSVSQQAIAADDPLTIVITESRSAETVDEAVAPVTVITRKDIEQKQATQLSDVLKEVPGISFSNNGGIGKNTSIFLRGTNSDQVLVLVDGVKVGSASLGTTPFHDLPIDQIEKIEVVRGPRSSLYGSEAIGGVIQIFTKKGSGEAQPEFSIGVGSNGLSKLDAGIGGGSESGWYRLGVSTLSTDGINDCRGDPDLFVGCFTVEPDEDSYDNDSISLRGGTRINQRFQLEGNVFVSSNETEFDGSFQNQSETKTSVTSVKSLFAVSDSWDATLLLAKTEDQSDNFLNGAFASTFDTERSQVSFQNDFQVGSNSVVIAGIDYIDDEVSGTGGFTVTSRDNTGVFVAYQTSIAKNSFEVSIRTDDNEQFGDETTGGIGWGRDLGNGKRVTASFGTAFKAPSFNELYFPDFGNPNLAPETSESIDIGFSNAVPGGRWAVNIYQTEIENLIGFDAATFLPANVEKAKISGIEFSGHTTLAGWDVGVSLTLQKPEDDSAGANQGNTLPRRAERIISLDATKIFGRFSMGGSIFNQDDSFDDLGNTTKLNGFTLVDVFGEMRINQNWVAGLKINNLFDENYETAAFFNQDGTNFLATLRYKPANR